MKPRNYVKKHMDQQNRPAAHRNKKTDYSRKMKFRKSYTTKSTNPFLDV